VFELWRTFRAVKFLVTAPLLLAFLFFINLVTTPGEWWVQWAALGIGIAWVCCLFRVLRTTVLLGGLALLGTWLYRRSQGQRSAASSPPAGPPPA